METATNSVGLESKSIPPTENTSAVRRTTMTAKAYPPNPNPAATNTARERAFHSVVIRLPLETPR